MRRVNDWNSCANIVNLVERRMETDRAHVSGRHNTQLSLSHSAAAIVGSVAVPCCTVLGTNAAATISRCMPV